MSRVCQTTKAQNTQFRGDDGDEDNHDFDDGKCLKLLLGLEDCFFS